MTEVRPLTSQDSLPFREFVQGLTPVPEFNWTPEELLAGLQTWQHWGVFEGEQLLATLAFQASGDQIEIIWIRTLPARQGQGHGSQLLHVWLDNAKHQYSKVLLEVHEANLGAQSLYESMGFQRTGQRKAYYSDGGSAWLYSVKFRNDGA